MDWTWVMNEVFGMAAGGGLVWLFTLGATRKKANGEATMAEAEGWKSMQSLYQKTIEDFNKYSEDMRTEREVLKKENKEMRDSYKKVEDEIIILKRQLARQGRKVEALTPFLCGVVGCVQRQRVNLSLVAAQDYDEDTVTNNEE